MTTEPSSHRETPRTLTVSITLRIEVDRDLWAQEWGIKPTVASVREDVRTFYEILTVADIEQLNHPGLITARSVRRMDLRG